MTSIHGEIRKWGNSFAFIIPAEKARELDLDVGQQIDAEVRKCQRVDGFGIIKDAKPFKREKEGHEW